jgi:hypothetical protein
MVKKKFEEVKEADAQQRRQEVTVLGIQHPEM